MHALVDGVLRRSGKCCEGITAGIRLAIIDRHAGQSLDRVGHAAEIGKVDAGFNTARVEVVDTRHQIHIAGPLAMTEKRAFNAIGTGHERQFSGRHGHALVVVRMKRNQNAVASGKVAAEIFDHVRIVVRRAPLDRGGEVHDQRFFRRCLAPRFENRLAKLN